MTRKEIAACLTPQELRDYWCKQPENKGKSVSDMEFFITKTFQARERKAATHTGVLKPWHK